MDNIRLVKDTPADPAQLRSVDTTGRQRLAVPRRQRDAARRGRAHVDGRGAINETVLVCRAAARLAAQDKASRARGGRSQAPASKHVMARWVAFVPTGRLGALTPAQASSLRKRSTRAELLDLSTHQRALIGLYL